MNTDSPELGRHSEFTRLLAASAVRMLSADAAAIWLVDESGAGLGFATGYGLASIPPGTQPILLVASSLQYEALARGSASLEDAAAGSREAELPPGYAAALCVSLGGSEAGLGALCVYSSQPRRFTSSDVEDLQALVRLGALFLELERRPTQQESTLQALQDAETERTRLAQVTTHQLRSPITIAQSLLQNLVKGYAGPITDRQRDVLDRIANQLDFLSHLVNDFLDLAASKAPAFGGQESAVAVNLSVARVVLLLQPRAEEKGVALTLRPCREELAVWASEEGLDHILHNLVENAVKYTPAGGQVTVSLARQDDEARVTVSDTGIGIPEEAQAHLFEEFYRASNARAANAVGTGLGLAIVKELVDRYHGNISVQSAGPEQGTVFAVSLPLHKTAP